MAEDLSLEDLSLSLQEAASLAGVSVTTLRRAIASGALEPCHRRNNRAPLRVTSEALSEAGFRTGKAVRPSDLTAWIYKTGSQSVTRLLEEERLAHSAEVAKLGEELELATRGYSDLEGELELANRAYSDLKAELELATRGYSDLEAKTHRLEIALATAEARLEERQSAFDQVALQIGALARQVAAIEATPKPRRWWRGSK